MSAKTKIVVLRMKEIIYTAIFVGFLLFLILLFVIMFRPKPDETAPSGGAQATETPTDNWGNQGGTSMPESSGPSGTTAPESSGLSGTTAPESSVPSGTTAPGSSDSASQTPSGTPESTGESQPVSYIPGIYSSALTLGNQSVNVEVTVDASRITSVTHVPLNESIATMYPLMQPAMESLAAQIVEKQSLEGIEYQAGAQYTSMALMNAIEEAVGKAMVVK